MTEDIEAKRRAALERLQGTGGAVVALSGGVDSALLLLLATEALGRGRVLAVTGRSPSLAAEDLSDARRVARALGVEHEVIETREMTRPAYRANAGDRCYHCRSELFDVLESVARQRGLPAVVYGAIADDLDDERPGMRAARERGVLAPLLEARFSKEEVRALARQASLPVHEKPAAACLASRIPAGVVVTEDRLRRVERAERALKRLGLAQLRVRDHGDVGRLEVDPAEIDRLADPVFRRNVASAVRAAGFRFVALDLDGYRASGMAGQGRRDDVDGSLSAPGRSSTGARKARKHGHEHSSGE